MSRFVVDASVAVKWFVPEPHSIDAVRLLESESTFAAPDLIATEVANTLWKKVRRGELEGSRASALLAAFGRVPVTMFPVAAVLPAAFELAVSLGRTVYDSVYLALAIALDRPLITADQKFTAAVAASRYATYIRLLGAEN